MESELFYFGSDSSVAINTYNCEIFFNALTKLLIFNIFKSCALVIRKATFTSNDDVMNMTFDYTSDDTGSFINATVSTFAVIEKSILYLKINLPSHDHDDNYLKSFLNIVVDIERLYKGVSGNFITNGILENLTKSIDFVPKFPFPKVL